MPACSTSEWSAFPMRNPARRVGGEIGLPFHHDDLHRSHCRSRLTEYKIPRYVEFRSELPKTNIGKIRRRALREKAA